MTRNRFVSDIWTVPNILSIYRLLAIIISCVLFLFDYPIVAVLLGISAGLTDYADGYYARKYNQITELGSLLDAVSDLLFNFFVLSVAVYRGVWPIYLLLLWGFRDLIVLTMRASAAEMLFRIPSSMLGKVASNFIFYSLIFMPVDYAFIHFYSVPEWLYLGVHWIGLGSIHVGIAMQWVAAYRYGKIYIKGYNDYFSQHVAED